MIPFDLNESHLQGSTLCGKHVKCIVDNEVKQVIIDHLFQHYNIRINCTNKYFREFDPATDFEILKKYKHYVYPNTHQRIVLLVLITFNDKPFCLLIDKQNNVFYVLNCQFSQSLYQGTVFEGEIIDDYFLISDFLVYMNKNIAHHALDRRLLLLKSIIDPKNYHYDAFLDPFQLAIKDFVEYHELLSYVTDYLPTVPYYQHVSGLVFRPNENSNKNLLYNFHHRYVSPSPPIQEEPKMTNVINHNKHPEVIFMLFETGHPDDYCLKLKSSEEQGIGSDSLIEYDYALVNDFKTSQYLQNLLDQTSSDQKEAGLPVLCRYIPSFQKWKPIQFVEKGQIPIIMDLI